MPQKIENKDIFSPDFLEPQKKSFKEIIELIKLMESEMKDVLKLQQQMLKTSDKKSVEGLKKRQKAVQSVNVVSKEMLKLEKQRISTTEQLALADSKEARAVQATRIELARKKKAVKDEILAEKGLIGEYKKQSTRLNDLRKKYKDLILVQGKETRATRKLRKEITTLDKRLKKVDAATGQFQRSVGNYGKAFGKVTGVLRNFGLAVGGLAIIRNITGIVRNFEQAQADLASVLGVNVEEMKALTDQARELGATTRFTAGEVSQLQKEFAKLGFDQTEIENMTEATLQLAAATGTELPRAAEVTGATLRGFGLDASETQRVVDVMAKSFSSSSLDMEKFATAMSSVAPVAKTAGLSVEKTTALLGTLTDRGLDASTAGTGLRNIFLELSKRGLSFEEAMLQINSATDKNAASLDLFGKRGATVGTILSETAEDVSNLEGKLNDAGGAAKEMADKQLNTLNGQLDLLKSAWEGFILDLEEGTGAFAGLKDVIGFVAKNLKTIIKVITVSTVAWVANRTAIAATSVITKASAAASALFRTAKISETVAVEASTVAQKGLNTAMKANPIGLIITLIAAAVTAYQLFADTATDAEKAQRDFNESAKEGAEQEKEQITTSNERLNKQFREIERSAKKEGKTIDEIRKQKSDAAEEERQQIARRIEEIKHERVDKGELALQELNNAKARQKQNQVEASQRKGRLTGVNSYKAEDAARVESARKKYDDLAGLTAGQLEEERKRLRELSDLIKDFDAEEIEGEINKNEELSDEREKARAKRRKELMLLQRMLEDLDNEAIIDEEKRQIETLKTKSQREIEAIKGNSQVEIELRNELKLKELREIAEIEDEFRKKRADEGLKTTQIIGQQEQEQLKESIKLQEIAAQKELDLQLEIAANKPEEVNVDELERLLNERFDLIKRALEDERDLMLLNEDLTAEERELINIQFNNKLAENERNRVKTVDDANNEIIDAQIETANKISDINTKAADEEARRKAEEDAKRKKRQQDQLNSLKQFAAKAIEISNAKTDKEIENTNKEIEASKTRQSELQTLAAQGNLTAQQSVSAEIKRELELERQKEALEKKKARRQIILEGLDLLSSKIDGGEKDAVTSTLNDMTRLLGALAALPGFIDGTETTVGAALGKPQLNTGTDDYIVRVDGSEKILNPGMSARTGNMTTEEITRAAEMYSSGMFDQNLLIHPQVAALNQPFQNSNEILKKFDSLETTIRNKPILSDLKFDDLQKALVVTVEQNGDLKRAHYKLK